MNISSDFVKGFIKDGYDYMFETYDQYEEMWPQIYAEKDLPEGDYWQRTSVITGGSWRLTQETEAYQPESVNEGFTVYGRVFDFTKAHAFTTKTVENIIKIKNLQKEIAGTWGTTAKETREEFYARPFNYGGFLVGDYVFNGTPESKAITDPSGNGVYDGTAASPMPFFNLSNNTRSSKGGGTYSNGFALDLSPANLKTVRTTAMKSNNRYENDVTRFNLNFDTLYVPVAQQDNAEEIMGSTLLAWGNTNTKNVLQNKLRIIINPYLTNDSAWFIGKSKMGIEALNRMEPKQNFFEDKKNRCWWYTVEQSIGVLIYNWRYWAGSQFATA